MYNYTFLCIYDTISHSRLLQYSLWSYEFRTLLNFIQSNFAPLILINPTILSPSFTIGCSAEHNDEAASNRARGAHFSAPCWRKAHHIGEHGAYATTGRLYNNNEHACTRFSRLKITVLKTAVPDHAWKRNAIALDPLSRQFLLAGFN